MKKFLALALVCLFLVPAAVADVPDISGLTFDELITLREKINLAIWQSAEWQEVTVPAGIWVIGEDIPAGHWTIRPVPGSYTSVVYCDKLDEFGTAPAIGWNGWNGTISGLSERLAHPGERTEVDLEMVEGMFFINRGAVIFTPYTGTDLHHHILLIVGVLRKKHDPQLFPDLLFVLPGLCQLFLQHPAHLLVALCFQHLLAVTDRLFRSRIAAVRFRDRCEGCPLLHQTLQFRRVSYGLTVRQLMGDLLQSSRNFCQLLKQWFSSQGQPGHFHPGP